jgi:hypothetical protein
MGNAWDLLRRNHPLRWGIESVIHSFFSSDSIRRDPVHSLSLDSAQDSICPNPMKLFRRLAVRMKDIACRCWGDRSAV